MAFNPVPTTWLAGWSEDGTDASFPLANMPELSAADADAVTGDWRKIWFAMIESMYNHWFSLATADRPTKIVGFNKTTAFVAADNEDQIVYTITLRRQVSVQEIADEA